jgi:hypothetical protein
MFAELTTGLFKGQDDDLQQGCFFQMGMIVLPGMEKHSNLSYFERP